MKPFAVTGGESVANGICVIRADAQSESWIVLLWGWGCHWPASAPSSLRPPESGNHSNVLRHRAAGQGDPTPAPTPGSTDGLTLLLKGLNDCCSRAAKGKAAAGRPHQKTGSPPVLAGPPGGRVGLRRLGV